MSASKYIKKLQKDIHEVLRTFWGYSSFRPLQEDIVRSILAGNDTLALMPTGGGKSITFQVPALATEGLCIVVTPLISLMKDQVENLKKREIKAMAIYSGLTKHEIDIALNNCIYGDYKFLYVSPERLSTDLFRIRLEKMNVNLIAVDEAHCISQWGYDFRPSYLKIAELRDYLPGVPVLALTATATKSVAQDIMEKLKFEKPNLLSKSFERTNLSYLVRYTEDKYKYILRIINNSPGSGIVYVRNRKKAKEIAFDLTKEGIAASYYHAGVSDAERTARQNDWKRDFVRVMVATNAFGMGIDKPDVRFVIHVEPPDSLEAYFQEAGRAGRDEKKSFAILLFDHNDQAKLERYVNQTFPDIPTIKSVYNALGNFLKIPYGGGKEMTYDFDIGYFCTEYKLSIVNAYNCLKILQREGYIVYNEDVNNSTKIYFTITRDDLYKFQVANAAFDGFIKLLLRSYTGLFTDFVSIDEQALARRAKLSFDSVYQYLKKLQSANIITYIPRRITPMIVYTEERLDDKNLYISPEDYRARKEHYEKQVGEVVNYVFSTDKCRSSILLEYFGEKDTKNCGTCDVCIRKTEIGIMQYEFEGIRTAIEEILSKMRYDVQHLIENINFSEEKVIVVIRWLLDNNFLKSNEDGKLNLNNKQ